MISEAEFLQMGNSLATGFFIDKVVMALAKVQKLGCLQEEDRPVIEKASSLLERVLEGERWLNVKKFDAHSGESALAFDRAARALPLHIRIPNEFIQYITRLKGTFNMLLQQSTAPDDEVKLVRRFFFSYGRTVFMEAQTVIEHSAEPRGLRLWTQRETT